MLAYLRHLFTSPSAYLHSWRGFLANQAGHGAIGLVLAHFTGWITLAIYAAWEIAQYRYSRNKSLWRFNATAGRVGSTASDGIGDWTFVASGVLAVLVHPVVLILTVAMLAEGVLVRRGN